MLAQLAEFSQRVRIALENPLRRFQLSLLSLAVLIGLSTVAYIAIEGLTPVDALYMTIITIATVGYGEVRPLSDVGRIFTMVLIILGVAISTAAISNAISILLGPLLWSSVQERRMKERIAAMDGHYIVCGYGRMGRQVVRDLQARGENFVVIDANEANRDALLDLKIPYINGDATRDETLLESGVERARGLVAALSNDSDNVMTVLSARELNPRLFIVARIIHSDSESKLRRAGANRVINPYQIGGHRIALSLLRPAVHDFLDHIFHFGIGQNIDIGQIYVSDNSPLAGQSVGSCDLRRVHQVNIIAILQPDGQLLITPAADQTLAVGATLIVIGPSAAIYQLERAT